MYKVSTMFLRVAIITLGLLVLTFSIFLVPALLMHISIDTPPLLYLPFGALFYLALIPFMYALIQGLILLSLIDKNKAFSKASVKVLSNIKIAAILVTIFLLPMVIPLYDVAQSEDAPGLILIGSAFIGAPFVVGVFAGLMEHLLQNAVTMKKENDLTV